jgi:hypothetical protein
MLSGLRRSRIAALWVVAVASILIALGGRVVSAQEMPDASPTPGGRMMIPEPLLVSLQAAPGYGPAPLLVGFLLNAVDPSGAEVVAYNWNFGDGHTSTEPPIMAYNTYMNPGTYIATVTITTADGRSATGFTGVIVRPGQASTPQQRRLNQ